MVFAKDGKDQVETNKTQEFLQNLVGKQNVRPPFIYKDEVRYWLCNSKLSLPLFYLRGTTSVRIRWLLILLVTVSTTQRDEAAKNTGVKSVGINQKGGYGRYLPRREEHPLPSQATQNSNAKAKRAISYSTYKNAVTELVEVSQPRYV